MNATFLSKYSLVGKIGEGSFSEVLKCEDRRTGRHYAAKRLKKVFKNAFEVANCAEIIAMNKLARHPNIVYMMEFHYEPLNGRLIFIFELMDMSMYDFMKMKKRRMPEVKVRNYLYQILKGLEHLHSHGLFHRDIKPENILIKLPTSRIDNVASPLQGELIKLADFGSIRGVCSKPPYTEYISTRWYRSPECLLTMGYYGPKMDVWATGCVFYEMLTLKPLFPGEDEIDQLSKIHEILGTPNDRILRKFKKRSRNFVQFPKQFGTGLKSLMDKISGEAIAVLQLMVQYDPDLRVSVRRLLDHRFFRTLRDEDLVQKFRCFRNPPAEVFVKSKGDFFSSHHKNKVYRYRYVNRSHYSPPSYSQYKDSSSQSSNRSERKRSSIHLVSKTNVDMRNYNSRVPFHQSFPADHTALEPQEFKIAHKQTNQNSTESTKKAEKQCSAQLSQKLSLRHTVGHQEFSKTTSNLPQISNCTHIDSIKAAHFQSKSLILPNKHIQTQNNVDNKLFTYKVKHSNPNKQQHKNKNS